MRKFVVANFNQFDGILNQEVVEAVDEKQALLISLGWEDIKEYQEISFDELLELCFNSDTPSSVLEI